MQALGKEEAGELVTGLVSLHSPPSCTALAPLHGHFLGGFPPELAEAGIAQPVRMAVTMRVVTPTQGALCMSCPGLSALRACCLFQAAGMLPKHPSESGCSQCAEKKHETQRVVQECVWGLRTPRGPGLYFCHHIHTHTHTHTYKYPRPSAQGEPTTG